MGVFKKLRFFLLMIITYCSPTPKAAGQFTQKAFDKMAARMAKGSVPDITTQELQKQMKDVILLDTREKAEFDVSHLPGAIWVGYDDFNPERVAMVAKDQIIVTYCSVGYRSERIGEKLIKAGYGKVFNLNGSLFRWVNEELPLVDSLGKTTNSVHGYDKNWGKWLKKGKVVY